MYCTPLRSSFVFVAAALVTISAIGCSKSKADEYSRFKGSSSVQATGAAPHTQLRYRPVAGEDVTYSLEVKRQCAALGLKAKMRLSVALKMDTLSGGGGTFVLRLVSVDRLDPPPPGGLPELGPAYVLLQGRLGPRGDISDLQDSDKLPSPVNLALVLPLLLPRLPDKAVGIGAKWTASGKHGWTRHQSADSLTNQAGFKGSTDVLLKAAYQLTARTAPKRPVVTGELTFKLRSRTRTLSHLTHHTGSGKAKARYVLDPASGLPVHAKITLDGTYKLRANDKTRPVKETIELTFKQQ